MKNLKKLFAGVLSVATAFMFFGCSDTEEDDDLVVTINADGTAESTSRNITMTYPTEYDGKKVYIAYTLDGSDPQVTFNASKYSETAEMTEYFDYGSASLYEGEFSVSESVTIKAKAFYINGDTASTSTKAAMGPVATKEVKVKSSITVSEDTEEVAPVSGKYTFKIASTGNQLYTHYFDTSAGTLFKWGDYEHCYYQIQFSYTKAGAGNWYLYVRQVGNAKTIPASNGEKFVAQGTYTGENFDDKKADIVKDGKITLSCTVGEKNYGGDYTITNKAFTMKVSGDAESAVTVGDAK